MRTTDRAAKQAAILTWIGVLACATFGRAADSTQAIDFTRDVRPILANNCFHCHGPDAEELQADLRLDVWKAKGDIRGAEAIIVRGKPAESELFTRITSDDPDIRMPPADSGKSLTPEQIETLKNWIAQGARYKQHWAFVAPERPAVPNVKNQPWVRNPIDSFVLARLESEGLEPTPPASPNSLLRRLSLDLIGLPPTPEEIAAFQAGDGEGVFEQQVKRLLASPHYGERWGRIWLDAARYADSDGFEKDKPRMVWMYRDWVINAFNKDMPYDDFLVEQMAGDLLPNPTQAQLVATGFLRNSMLNEEGGVDPEQFRMEAMYDRMDAVGKAILGLTTQCAQCHTHKYDPLTHAEYYRMFAFFNSCHEAQITTYTPKQNAEWQATQAIIHQIEEDLRAANPDWQERMAAWEESVRDDQPEWTVVRPKDDRSGDQKHFVLDDGSVLAAGYAPTQHTPKFSAEAKMPKITAVRLELLNDSDLPRGGPGRSMYGTCALSEFQVEGAIKLHTLLDLRGNIPCFMHVSHGKTHDVTVLDQLPIEPGAFYVMDRGYVDFQRLYRFTIAAAFFVTRGKRNLDCTPRARRPIDKATGLRSDQTIVLTGAKSSRLYPDPLRRVAFYDAEHQRRLVFLTNNFTLPALTIARLYKCRWQVELFFKWIKQHLRIKTFYGTSDNAVKTQVWIAISVYVLVAIVKKELGIERSLYEILQVLSLTLFEKISIIQALYAEIQPHSEPAFPNQLTLFDL